MDTPIITLPQEIPGVGVSASDAARLSMKSAGINPEDPQGVGGLTAQVMQSLKSQGIDADPMMVKAMVQQAVKSSPLIQKATDPVIL